MLKVLTQIRYVPLVFLVAFGCLLGLNASAAFTGPVVLSGYAWSSNIGWISLNCDQTFSDTCSLSDYKVQINPDFTISGYAWSSNIGWIQFGGLSSCPGGLCDARLDSSTNELLGWARALSYGDGWDGWISLNCQNTGQCGVSNYGVKAGFGNMTNYAWGSDVVGWVNFDAVTFISPCLPGSSCTLGNTGNETQNQWCEVTSALSCAAGEVCSASDGHACVPSVPLGTISANPVLVRSAETTDISWSVNPTAFPLNCKITQLANDLVIISDANPTGSTISNAVDLETDMFLTCVDVTGVEHIIDSVVIKVLPKIEET